MNSVSSSQLTIARTIAIIAEGLQRGASDVHFTPGARVKLRIHGDLENAEKDGTPWDPKTVLESWAWITGSSKIPAVDTFRVPDDRTTTVVHLPDQPPARLRLHAKSMEGGMGYTVRYLPQSPWALASLGLPDRFVQLCETRSSGLILVCGATNAGKSTTGYSILDHLVSTQKVKAVTFESPIEVLIPNEGKPGLVQQHDIPIHMPDYETAQCSSLRDDPDIVLYSELRTDTAIQKAVSEANTGHLVFGTLHTGTAAQSLMRLMAARPEGNENSYLQGLAQCLVAVLCQRLVKDSTGKRVPNYEFLMVDDAVAGVLNRGDFKQLDNAITTGGDSGMISFDAHLAKLVSAGRLTVASALAASPLPRATLSYLVDVHVVSRGEQERLKNIYVV